ncbi:hypothetical protein B7463_g7755, partial [Scytalidium lignicola]
MVSLWPWKGKDNSPESFEKALSSLAAKISASQQHLDYLRQHGRRNVALWTLYTSFAYLFCFIVLFLVVGWQNLTALEYTALAGSPVLIYLIRGAIASYYNFRIDGVTQRLEEQQTERTKTIERLKAATKYNSTRDLLEKYGGVATSPKKRIQHESSKKSNQTPKQQQPQRTRTSPPATANIPRNNLTPNQPSTPRLGPPINLPPISTSTRKAPPNLHLELEQTQFAPNAFPSFPSPQHYAQSPDANTGGNWYDRVLDVLLGEDETLPKSRIVLICQHCRLVNGQAPPGTNNLADLGKWRCFGCGGWNGEEDEGLKAVQEMKEKIGIESSEQADSEAGDKASTDIGDNISNGTGVDAEAADDETHSSSEAENEYVEDSSDSNPQKNRSKGSREGA